MSLVINTNLSALSAQRNLMKSTMGLNRSLEKLASGFRINGARDDAAGLQISENLRTQIRGEQKALDNVQDGNNVLNIAEGSYQTITDNLQRMRELIVQANNDTNSNAERRALQQEMIQLKANITQVAAATAFNGRNLLNGSTGSFRLQIGANSASTTNTINVGSVLTTATYGALVAGSASYGSAGTVTLSGATLAQRLGLLNTMDAALRRVNERRALIGAFQNRLDSTANNLQISIENKSASESRIRNVDVARETTNLTRLQILQQAGVTVLAQANQSTSLALNLLRG